MLFKVYFGHFCDYMNGENPKSYVIVENKSARINTIRKKVSKLLNENGLESVPFDNVENRLSLDSPVWFPFDIEFYNGDEMPGTIVRKEVI